MRNEFQRSMHISTLEKHGYIEARKLYEISKEGVRQKLHDLLKDLEFYDGNDGYYLAEAEPDETRILLRIEADAFEMEQVYLVNPVFMALIIEDYECAEQLLDKGYQADDRVLEPQIADELGIRYVSFSLTHHTRNSLLGLPVIKELEDGGKYTSYTMSEVIAKVLEAVERGHKEGILLLDEFPCMSETIMPAMLAFLQTKNIGTHHLPEGWVIVLCGNPSKYNKSAKTFDAAIVDRLRKLEIQFEPNVFIEYAQQIEMHPYLVK